MERKLRNAVRTVSITTSIQAFGQRILIKKAWPAQAQSVKLKLIIVGAKPPLKPFNLNGKSGLKQRGAELYFFTAKLTSSLASNSVL